MLDYIYNKKDNEAFGVVSPSAGIGGINPAPAESEENPIEKFCLKHPQKKTKYFCENCQIYICSKCVVGEHKGHRISDHVAETQNKMDPVMKKKQVLVKKVEASLAETEIFEDDVIEIED